MSSQPPTFQIGMTMAGAISAGAYSAGVMDFLFQALDDWYRARQGPDADALPSHHISINVLCGASAGAITAALLPAALRFGVPDLTHGQERAADYTLESLYRAWVVRPDLRPVDGHQGLLGVADLKRDGTVRSLLNSDVLHAIGTDAFTLAPANAAPAALPYVSRQLHVYLTLTNLRGVPYQVRFTSGQAGQGYGMLNHGDRAHFIVHGLGTSACTSSWALTDPGTDLDPSALPVAPTGADAVPARGWQHCLQAALASSAFPLGLAPRAMQGDARSYRHRQWPFPHDLEPPLAPDFPAGYTGDSDPPSPPHRYHFTSVDGGLLDNEPFEYAHYALKRDAGTPNARHPAEADRAVLMIDPFPEPPAFNPRGDDQDRGMVAVLVRMLGILKDQSRFKPAELAAAMDHRTYSRFLVAPRRYASMRRYPGAPLREGLAGHAIASGLLGGFGGFFLRTFRDFDYQLGRRNCQKFLRETFVLDARNPVVAGWSPQAASNPAYSHRADDGTVYRCILPLVGRSAGEVHARDWPRLPAAELDAILKDIRTRLAVVYPRLKARLPHRLARLALGLAWPLGLRARVLNALHWTIKCDLIRRDQDGDPAYRFESEAERVVIASLADPAHDLCTVAWIAQANALSPAMVERILKTHQTLLHHDQARDAWALAARRGGLLRRVLGRITGGAPKIAG